MGRGGDDCVLTRWVRGRRVLSSFVVAFANPGTDVADGATRRLRRTLHIVYAGSRAMLPSRPMQLLCHAQY
eukprot:1916276-Rhodomonas_salina.1